MKKNGTKAYQSETRLEEIGFTNFERIDESELFNIVMEKLHGLPDVEIGAKQVGPSEDYYNCKIAGSEFTIIYDLDYGVSIYVKDPTAREFLIDSFNKSVS